MPTSGRERSSSSPSRTRRKSKQDNMFGPYVLLYTIGEGEFAKVKYGIHSENGDEAAIKLIRKDNVDGEKLSKIKREISVLKSLNHPYIVNLIEVIETQNYIGIVLEYASGGELFDYILAHRYLKEREACRLFAQLICGVDYIHRNKIIHRDLKLENLLLDRNRNVIITDFGFANQFGKHGDDLMATSCGSPCYAAPELVVSEGMYAGSAVDIWSCGVILYAMLAGYLPFDDDPENPEGDNINLLYKYILSTPLSFPDYIGSDARDLLRKMLVPDPHKRCKIKDIMGHRWMAPYKGLFEEFRLQAKVSFATGVPPPLDNEPKSNEVMTKARRHTMHVDPSPKMVEANLKKEKAANAITPNVLNNEIDPHEPNLNKSINQINGVDKEAQVNNKEGIEVQQHTSKASNLSNDPSVLDQYLPSSNSLLITNTTIINNNNAKDNNDIYQSNQPINPFDPNSVIAPTQLPLDPFDPNSTILFSTTKTNSEKNKPKVKARPISMQPQSTNESQRSNDQHFNSVGPSIQLAPLALGSPTSLNEPLTPTSELKKDKSTRPVSFGPVDSLATKPTRSNRADPRKALSAFIEPTATSNANFNMSTNTYRKSTLSPTGTTAKRISDWIKRKSIVLKGNSIPNFEAPNTIHQDPYDGPNFKVRDHRGAVDQFALSNKDPPLVIEAFKQALIPAGFIIEKEYGLKLKVTRPPKPKPKAQNKSSQQKFTKKFTFPGLRGLLHRRHKSQFETPLPSEMPKMVPSDSPSPSPTPSEAPVTPASSTTPNPAFPSSLYGDASIDNGEEVKVLLEICRVRNFENLYIVDIKRVKGNVWSYKYLYHHMLNLVELEDPNKSNPASRILLGGGQKLRV